MAVQISILVANAASLFQQGHTRIEVWRSDNGTGPWQEITSSSPTAAVLTSSKPQTQFRMGGRTLRFKVNGGTERSITFPTTFEYWTPEQVKDLLLPIAPGLVSLDTDGRVLITSPTVGRVSSLEITYCDADSLGWSAGDAVRGTDARPALSPGQPSYLYSDVAGFPADKYKWRFSGNGANPISAFSVPAPGAQPSVSGAVSICSAIFVGVDGRPVRRKVLVSTLDAPQSISGFLVGNNFPLTYEADENGYVQFALLQGSKVRVAIESTLFVREFVVPSTPTFDLLTAMSDAADPYTIQRAPDLIIRRSL